jgi:hypothetical protein
MRYLLLTLLLLAGCVKPTWHRPDQTPELFARDNGACEERAVDAASKGSRREKQIYSACMTEKGWTFSRQFD